MSILLNKNHFLFLFLLFSLACSQKKIVKSNSIQEGSNLLLERPSFSLGYNKSPNVTIAEVDSGQIILPQLIYKGNCVEPLTEITFAKALVLIEKETNNLDKMELSKKIIENNCLTTFQIKRLADFYRSETSKLELVEHAYPFCYDTHNYFTLEKEFVLANNKEKFKAIIK